MLGEGSSLDRETISATAWKIVQAFHKSPMISTLNENSEINIADSNGEYGGKLFMLDYVGMKHLSPQYPSVGWADIAGS